MNSKVILSLALAYCFVGANAQETNAKLINIDAGSVPAQSTFNFSLNVRFFGNEEDALYGGAQLNFGLGNGLGLILRGAAGRVQGFAGNGFTIRHGGSDLEAMLIGRMTSDPNLSWGVGISKPNTPAQDQVFVTAMAHYRFQTENATFYLGPRAALRNNGSIAGIGGGFSARMGSGFELVGDLTGILVGDNTYSVNSGRLRRDWIYGLGVRVGGFASGSSYTFDAGITNGLGGTTGFSLTPALGNSLGFYVGLNLRY